MSNRQQALKSANNNRGARDTEPLLNSQGGTSQLQSRATRTRSQRVAHYKEKRQFFCCYPLKCGFFTMGILLIVVLCIEIINTILIYNNEYFDILFPVVYASILIIYCAGGILMLLYFIMDDSAKTRFFVPWAFLLAGICEILLAIWIVIFIFCLYDHPRVYITAFEDGDFSTSYGEDEQNKKYVKESKAAYTFKHLLLPILSSILFLIFYTASRDWAQRHRF